MLTGGRVIDPETKLDAVKNVGIINNRIAQITSDPIKGKQELNVTGLVVAPGFIDLHVHGRSNAEQEYQLHDGLTTALELEWGIEFLQQWYDSRKSKALINYGASVSWPFERCKAMDKYKDSVNNLYHTDLRGDWKIDHLLMLSDLLIPIPSVLQKQRKCLPISGPRLQQEASALVYQSAICPKQIRRNVQRLPVRG